MSDDDLTFEAVARLAEARDARALWHVLSRAYKERNAALKATTHWQGEAKAQKEYYDRRAEAEGLVRPEQRGLTFRRFRERNVERCETVFHRIEDWSYNDWLGALTGELGEIANVIKAMRRKRPVARQQLDDEGRVLPPGVEGVSSWMREYGPAFMPMTDEERTDLGRELADLTTYIDLLAEAADIDLGEAVVEKFNIVSEREGSDIKL
jgi:NTP pyrophosphatase (non-canonical NTP hydrolase)